MVSDSKGLALATGARVLLPLPLGARRAFGAEGFATVTDSSALPSEPKRSWAIPAARRVVCLLRRPRPKTSWKLSGGCASCTYSNATYQLLYKHGIRIYTHRDGSRSHSPL